MYWKAVLLLLTSAITSCADPKYAPPGDLAEPNPKQKLETCQAQFTSGICVSYAWEIVPKETEFGSFIFKTFRQNAVDLDETLAIVLWMPSMGHGSSPVTVERLDVGTYRASNVFFIMKGDWEIRFQLKDGNEIKDQAIIPIHL